MTTETMKTTRGQSTSVSISEDTPDTQKQVTYGRHVPPAWQYGHARPRHSFTSINSVDNYNMYSSYHLDRL